MNGSVFVLLVLSELFGVTSAISRQYHYINTRISWSEAQSYCREKYTDLATVDSMDDVNKLVNIVDAGNSGDVWIGLKRGTGERWVWSNGENTLALYSAWTMGDPLNQYKCGCIGNGEWFTFTCSESLYFVCYSGSTGYVMIENLMNWTDAQSYCRQNYTDLSTIRNAQELNQIKSVVPSDRWLWIGLFQDSWEWSDKWSLFFRHWAAGQPSQISGSGDCGGMSTTNSGKWAQHSCDLKQPFVCYGDDILIKRQIVRLKLSCNGKCTLNDPSLQTAILNEISGKLKNMGLESENKISWRKGEGEEVFHEEINHTANSNNKCNGP